MNATEKAKIKQFIQETFLMEFNEETTENSDLFKQGIIDSFGYIQLIKYLEREFGIKFSEEDMLSNILVSFSAIVDSVENKTQASANVIP
jgi:acyl carrier protein